MTVQEARFLNYKETVTMVKIRNRSRRTVFIGVYPTLSADNGYPLSPGEVIALEKPVPILYVVR